MTQPQHVYLIPGFLGFKRVAQISYFGHVCPLLEEQFRRASIPAVVREIYPPPTASIRKRAARVFEVVRDTAGESGPIHLIGHSTGGLDARLFATPDAALQLGHPEELEALASRVRSVVSIATPHYGAPIAASLSSLMGAKLLRMLAFGSIYTMEFGRLPLGALLAAGRIVTRLDDLIGLENSVLDALYDKLLSDFDEDAARAIKGYLGSISRDSAALGQLTPGGIDLLNASAADRESARYGSVVMKADKPGWGAIKSIGADPYRQTTHLLYRLLYRIGGSDRVSYPTPTPEQERTLIDAYGRVPDGMQVDGIVPSRSQVWGNLLYAGRGDHLDVVGHFNDPERDPPHYDWLATGTGFDRKEFEALWGAVGEFLMAPHGR